MGKTLSDVHESDVIKAIHDALKEQKKDLDGYYTRREYEELLDWKTGRVRKMLHKMKDMGRLDAKRKPVPNIMGDLQQIPAFKILSENGQQPEGDE